MRHTGSRGFLIACLSLILLSLASGTFAQTSAPAEAPGSQTLATLYGNVYLQTSAEYRACCHGIFAAAGYRLEELLEEADPTPLRPAVVMDLDMTVLDVSSFQTFLYVNDLKYTPELWVEYEMGGVGEVALVPGAKAFIERVEGLGVAVVYLSNRNESTQERTIAALERLGLNTMGIPERIYLKPEGASSDKSPRRDAIAARYNVLMYLGDNLRDFSEVFKPAKLAEGAAADEYSRAIGERARSVDEAACHWGVDWFVLPNPVYGEWEKLITSDPAAILRPSGMGTAPAP
jgi:5'-nucleotidase (lipoprotein e(P4) family)